VQGTQGEIAFQRENASFGGLSYSCALFPPISFLYLMHDKTHEPLKSIYVSAPSVSPDNRSPRTPVAHLLFNPFFSSSSFIVDHAGRRRRRQIYQARKQGHRSSGCHLELVIPRMRGMKSPSEREMRFAWAPPLPNELYPGIVDDEQVPRQRVDTFIWPMLMLPSTRLCCIIKSGGGGFSESLCLNENVSL
jgi:hypothetical protein